MSDLVFLTIHGVPSKDIHDESKCQKLKLDIKSQIKDHEIFNGPVRVSIKFCMPTPKGTSKKRRAMMVNGDIKHTKYPNIDDLMDFVVNGLLGTVFKNSDQIFQKNALKRYANTPRTEIAVRQIGKGSG